MSPGIHKCVKNAEKKNQQAGPRAMREKELNRPNVCLSINLSFPPSIRPSVRTSPSHPQTTEPECRANIVGIPTCSNYESGFVHLCIPDGYLVVQKLSSALCFVTCLTCLSGQS